MLAIHKTFVTPFDRSQILDLITALDHTIDLMKDTGRRMVRYGVAFTPEMQGMADCAVRAAVLIRDGMPLLGSISRALLQTHWAWVQEYAPRMSAAVRQP